MEFRHTNLFSFRIVFILLIIAVISILYYMNIKFAWHNIALGTFAGQVFMKTPYEQNIRCVIYVQERLGRLGNRMFLIASAYGLARLHSCHIYITPQIIGEMKRVFLFNLSSLLISPSLFRSLKYNIFRPMNSTSKSVGCQYIPELTRPNGIPSRVIFEVRGFWQSYLHFVNYDDELREQIFVATHSVLKNISTLFGNIYQRKFGETPRFSLESHQSFKSQLAQSNLLTWIGIHVRRSDFIALNYSSSNEYLFFAMQYYTLLYPNAYFLLASDDKSYCENLFHNQSNIFITPQSFSPGDDLITLSLCQHSIITSGTFGWWVAYLAHGQVLHDKVYPSPCERREHYYPPWFMIDGKN